MRRRQFGSVRKLPSGRWQVRYRAPSGELLPGPETFPTKADADAFLARQQVAQQRGEWFDPRRAEIMFGEWVRVYETAMSKWPTTAARDRSVIERHLLPHFRTM